MVVSTDQQPIYMSPVHALQFVLADWVTFSAPCISLVKQTRVNIFSFFTHVLTLLTVEIRYFEEKSERIENRIQVFSILIMILGLLLFRQPGTCKGSLSKVDRYLGVSSSKFCVVMVRVVMTFLDLTPRMCSAYRWLLKDRVKIFRCVLGKVFPMFENF